jgi:hypothetical protein
MQMLTKMEKVGRILRPQSSEWQISLRNVGTRLQGDVGAEKSA